jgi:hypothetical protein
MTSKPKTSETINIRPGVTILSILRHLNYRPWFAIAEFVDNAIQSFLDYKDELELAEGEGYKLKVSIEFDAIDGGLLTVRDNAAGIHEADYPRAFRPAELPPDQSGLSEFGIGMKSAACWFAPEWKVRTTALGEPIERTVSFNIDKIVRDELEELKVQTRKVQPNSHYTEITLSNLHQPPQGRTVTKIKDHLASIYRVFIRNGTLELFYNGDKLSAPQPKILKAPYYKTETSEPVLWRKEIEFDFGLGLKAYGFAALLETANSSRAGFALLRRHRLIEGGADEGYRPEYIFGKPNSYRYQRLIGELELEGFEVSHTKDGFQWAEYEDIFLELLKEELNSKPLPLLDQAEGYRAKPKKADLKQGAEIATARTAETIKRELPPVFEKQLKAQPDNQPPPAALPTATIVTFREMEVELHKLKWQIFLELSNDPSIGEWLTVSDKPLGHGTGVTGALRSVRRIYLRIALAHPFTERFGGVDLSQLEPLVRVAVAVGLGETAARDSGVKQAATIRRNMNDLLREVLSKH